MNKPLPLYPGSRPCVQSGMCCRTGACAFGEWDVEKKQCKYLKDLDNGQTECGKYGEILGLPTGHWKWNPAFGAGCCMPLFNEARNRILEQLRADIRADGGSPSGRPGLPDSDCSKSEGSDA